MYGNYFGGFASINSIMHVDFKKADPFELTFFCPVKFEFHKLRITPVPETKYDHRRINPKFDGGHDEGIFNVIWEPQGAGKCRGGKRDCSVCNTRNRRE
jgi:hypothetical protein